MYNYVDILKGYGGLTEPVALWEYNRIRSFLSLTKSQDILACTALLLTTVQLTYSAPQCMEVQYEIAGVVLKKDIM